jgi:DNA uptake protein ComE-like DNA-binding protein
MSPKLPLYEWCIVILFCTILLTFATIAFLRRSYPAPVPFSSLVAETESLPVQTIQVSVEGAVAHPGLYPISPNTPLKELMERVQPLPSADLSQLRWRKKLYDQQIIRIPEKHEITIHLEGAVKHPGPSKIWSGTRYLELAHQLDVLPEADLKAIKKKRQFIKEGDHVYIPTKNKPSQN